MCEPCPFCGFETSDFRESFNWRCSQCENDYATWLIAQKARVSPKEQVVEKQPLFKAEELPSGAKTVKFAQSLLISAVLGLLVVNLVIDGVFSWVYPFSIPFAGYYAFTIYKTGYALGQHTVYRRDRNPILYKAHLCGVIGYIFVAIWAWVD